MRHTKWSIRAGTILFFALLFFFDSIGFFAALLPAVIAHELGHVMALLLFRRRIIRVSIRVIGVKLDYAPQVEGLQAVLCILAGPLLGMIYGVIAMALHSDYFLLSGSISIFLTAFNCLPILPLDGGRLVASILQERAARRLSLLCALLLTAGGIMIAVRFSSYRLLLMGTWLFLRNLASLLQRKHSLEKACHFGKHGIE